MDTRKRRKRKNEDTIPCACGCGELIYKYGTDGRERRFVRGHQFFGNQFGRKPYDLDAILAEAESLRPFCACGCSKKLVVPDFLKQKGKGLGTIQSHWKRHPYLKGHGVWDKRTENFLGAAESLLPAQLGLVYGTLLGDGSINYPNQFSRFPRLVWTHGIAQRAWLSYKSEQLPQLRPQLTVLDNAGYGETSIRCSTCCHPALQEVANVVRPDRGAKTVSAEWLEQITIAGRAWWYLDDGSLSLTPEGSPQIQFHTEGFSEAENQLLAEWLGGCGYPAKVRSYVRSRNNKRYYYLAMGAESARKWIADHECFAIPEMAYKFGSGRVCQPRWGGKGL